MKFEVMKGMKDSIPSEQIEINRVLDVIRINFERYGFRPFDTPLIEYLETLTNKYDEDAEIVGEIFKVKDRGNRDLGLRYDLTIPLCRYIASQKQLKLPFKRYAIGKVFRDGPIKAGRSREFMQCDADIVGIEGQKIEAETLKMFFDTYKELGIKPILEVNNNKILRGALLQEGFKEKDLDSVILSIDKLKKVGEKGVLDEIKSKKLDEKKAKEGIKILSSKSFSEIKKLSKNELLTEGISELEELTLLLKELKVEFRVNCSMSRGLNYYTGNIWEMYDKTEKFKSSIGSGGRYDKGIGNYIDDGREFPAFGVSFGLVPILVCLESESKLESLTDVVVCPLEEELYSTSLKIAQSLREKGKNVEICYDYKLKKGFSYAEFVGASEIVIFGKNDLEEGVYTIKNLETKDEVKVRI
jgi:histidyl-tRNA synthetase